MKTLNKLSNRQMTLLLFGVLALNISWMQSSMNSADFASSISVGSQSSACPNLAQALQTAAREENRGQVVTLTCNSGDGEVNDENFAVDRFVHITVSEVEVSTNQQLAGGGETGGETYPAFQYTLWTEVGTEASTCSECSRTRSQNITETVRQGENVTFDQLAGRVGGRLDSLFDNAQNRMLRDAEDILAAAEREEREERLEEARSEFADRCEVERDAPLSVIDEAQNSGSFGEYALEGEDKLNCLRGRMASIRDPQERTDYFYSQLMPYLQTMLTSGDAADHRTALGFMNSLGSHRSLAQIPGGFQSLMLTRDAFQLSAQATRLANMAASDPNNQNLRTQIDLFRQTINTKFGLMAQSAPAGSPLSEISTFWHSHLSQTLGDQNMDPLARTLVDLSTMTYTGNRAVRILPETQLYVAGQMEAIRQYTAANQPGMGGTALQPTIGTTAPPLVNNGGTTGVTAPPQVGTRAPRIPVN